MLNALEVYLQKKSADLENSKLQMKTAHVNKINSVYQNETENWNKVMIESAGIIQQNFLLLRSMGELDNSMLDKLQHLLKLLQGERSVKFAEVTDSLNIHNIMNLTDCGNEEVQQSPVSSKKRLNDDNDLENESKKSKNLEVCEEFQFLRPKALKSINFDSAPAPNVETGMNITFDLNVAGPSGSKSVLSERSNRPISSGAIKSEFFF